MRITVNRQAEDLSRYPNLIIIDLGMRVNGLMGLKTVFGFGPRISASVGAQPMGSGCMKISFSLGSRLMPVWQYWRDMQSLLAWTVGAASAVVEVVLAALRGHQLLA